MKNKIGIYVIAWNNFDADIFFWDEKVVWYLTCTGLWMKTKIKNPTCLSYKNKVKYLGV